MPDQDNRIVKFDQLNWLGKTVYLAGAAVNVTSSLIDTAVQKAADVYVDAERAFKQGLDPGIEDAKILEEQVTGHESAGSARTAEPASNL